MIEFIGIIGAILLSICGLPELIRSFIRKKCDIGYGFLSTWLGGEILVFIYIILTTLDIILLVNYGFNILIILGLFYYKLIGEQYE